MGAETNKTDFSTSPYLPDKDLFKTWANERLEAKRGQFVASAKLYEDWARYIEINGNNPGSTKLFGQMMRRHGFEPRLHRISDVVCRGFNNLTLSGGDAPHAR